MKVIQKVLAVEAADYYKKHLSIVNILLPTNLTEKEIEVLATFLSLDKNITEGDMFNTLARKKVMKELKLSPGGLGNHLKSLLIKKVINKVSEESRRLKVKEFLIPEKRFQGYQIKIVDKSEVQ